MSLNDNLTTIGNRVLPRILTQICRDPGSPFWGCCDRNWWHYKIRDFPSAILQQAGYTIALSGEAATNNAYSAELKTLARGTCRFWNQRAQLHGAFEEYYPYEQGYPPVAFSTLAVAKLCRDGVTTLPEVLAGFEVASRQLLSRFESEASNQQVAGTAALAIIRVINPELVPELALKTLLNRTLDLQKAEGWFNEYDGPDLGYLSVTMDCLWDIYDTTGDERYHSAILKAFEYLSWFVLGPIGGAQIHNSRNTDYIVPYGIARLACEASEAKEKAMEVVEKLYGQDNEIYHFFDAVDDRYWCHYIGHSVFRAINVLSRLGSPEIATIKKPVKLPWSMPESGHVLLRGTTDLSPNILVSKMKGAVFTALWPGGEKLTDCGWIIRRGKKQYVSHWWSPAWKPFDHDGVVGCDGNFVSHREHVSLPWKHVALRALSFILGKRVIGLLKRLMIFKKNDQTYTFCRRIRCEGSVIIVEDRIGGFDVKDKLCRAPRSSKRHVASADNFHPEDLKMIDGVIVKEDIRQKDGEEVIVTHYFKHNKTAG